MANGISALDPALSALGAGDAAAALSGLGNRAAALEEALRLTGKVSSFNRGAQFFLWGLMFRPVEYKISGGGRLVFTFMEIMRDRP